MSWTTGNREQHARLMAVLTPSGHKARLVLSAVGTMRKFEIRKVYRLDAPLTDRRGRERARADRAALKTIFDAEMLGAVES